MLQMHSGEQRCGGSISGTVGTFTAGIEDKAFVIVQKLNILQTQQHLLGK